MTKDQQQQQHMNQKTWHWESEELTSAIVAQLQRGDVLETRAFLKPIFRYSAIDTRSCNDTTLVVAVSV